MDVEIINDILHIPKSNWKTVIKEIIKLNGTFDLKINHSNVSDIEKDYQSKLELFESIENKENIRKLNEIRSEIVDIEKNIRISLDSISSYVNTQNQQTQNKLDSRLNSALIEYIKHARQTCTTNNNIESISFLDKTPPHIQSEITKEINWQKSRIDKINQETSLSKTIIKEPSYIVKINKDEIITRINDIKTNYIARVNKINSNSLTLSEIETFLSDTTNDLNLISTLRDSNSIIDKIISLKANKNTDDRVSISPHTIFDTGFDIALYGGAGVGKTTTLQAYSRKKRKNTIIYLPLNRILQKVIKILKTQEDRSFLKDDLIWKIILVSKDITPNEDNIKKVNELLLNKTSLILDGLDEIYSSISEIIPAIAEFKDKRPDIQIIISSRDCVSYLNKIKFLGITLLPFTKIQLDKFILGWLNDDIKAEQLKNSINELNLYDYIKTPLLATITCSLVERGVKIPANECAIYTERFKLLTGEYDQHKNINRQKQSSEILRKCAISLAFMMQQNNIRATSKNEMLGFLVKSLSDHYEKDLLEKCLNELIDPCNLLFFDRLTESYSFGHFRFQEHLATLELKSNRGIDITELTKFDWWRGTLGLYAQDTEFSHLFEDIYNSQGNLFKAQETLEFMINNAPKTKQNGLFYLFNKYKESDYLDDIFIDSSDHYSSY